MIEKKVSTIRVKKRNGKLEEFIPEKVNKCVERACEGLDGVYVSELVLDAHLQLFDGVKSSDIDKALILTARSKIYQEPNYSLVAARLLLNTLYKEVFADNRDADVFNKQYKLAFVRNTKLMVKRGILSKKVLKFDLDKISEAIVPDRDLIFQYHGLQNIYDRYLLRLDGRVMETPQAFYMRVAIGLSFNEPDKEDKAIMFYNTYSQHLSSPSTPTLFNSGTTHSQMSSCFLSTMQDSIEGIFEGLLQEAKKSKYAGGLGFDVTNWRSSGALVRGTNGKSSGIVPWLKVYNDMLIAVDQGGKRAGSGCAYLETWHLDIEDFLELRRNNGEERRRTHDLNTANWIPDLFLERVEKDEKWTLFCPSETRELHELYGKAFEKKYVEFEKKASAGELKMFRVVQAKDLWKKMLKMLFETSHPWICFKDPSNIQSPQQHDGVVHSSNLCLTGDMKTLVQTNTGAFPITLSELLELKNSITDPIKILSYDENLKQIIFKEIENVVLTGIDQEVIEVEDVTTGKSIKCTKEHKIFTKNRGYVEAQHLLENDELEII